MFEKEILKKIVAGEYFKEGDYFTEEQLKYFRYFVRDLRVIIEKNRDYYFDTIKNLIDSSDIRKINFGICFLRCYLDKEEILAILKKIIEDTKNPFQTRLQAIYEHLEEESTSEGNKQKWYQFIKDHVEEYNQSFLRVFVHLTTDKDKLFSEILEKRLSTAKDNKRWIYLIELSMCGADKEKVKDEITKHTESEDKFVSKVARECLQQI